MNGKPHSERLTAQALGLFGVTVVMAKVVSLCSWPSIYASLTR
nr:MAG TPA: hypothetical protein [Caudoviricetes sp.]